jgi:hypothetical protein
MGGTCRLSLSRRASLDRAALPVRSLGIARLQLHPDYDRTIHFGGERGTGCEAPDVCTQGKL